MIPAACHTAARDTITAHSTGWVTAADSRPGAPSAPSITSWRSHPTCGASARPHSASLAANTGEAAASSRPIPAHWAPWPGNTNTTRPAPPAGTEPAMTAGCGSPEATAARPAGPSPSTTARCSNTDREVASDQATSARSRSGWLAACAASRAACAARPGAVRPETIQGTTSASSSGAGRSAAGGSSETAGGSSRMMCALVPLIPNADTPARRGRSPSAGQGTGSASRLTWPADQSI